MQPTESTSRAGSQLLAEIGEQPERWRVLLDAGWPAMERAGRLLRERGPSLVLLAGRGTSGHAALYAQHVIHSMLRVPALLLDPSAATMDDFPTRYPPAVMIAISQSGASPDLVETVISARAAGVTVIALTNDESSALATAGDVHVPLLAGPEHSVAASKTYTTALLAVFTIVSLASGKTGSDVRGALGRLISDADVLFSNRPDLDPLVRSLAPASNVLFIGSGVSTATAREGALKLMETSAIAASGWSAADAIHGPLGQVTERSAVVALLSARGAHDTTASFLNSAVRRGGTVWRVGADDEHDLPLPCSRELERLLVPLLEIIPLQLLAHDVSLAWGRDPDRPPGLRKVTLTR